MSPPGRPRTNGGALSIDDALMSAGASDGHTFPPSRSTTTAPETNR